MKYCITIYCFLHNICNIVFCFWFLLERRRRNTILVTKAVIKLDLFISSRIIYRGKPGAHNTK